MKTTAKIELPSKRRNLARWRENRMRRLRYIKRPTERQMLRKAELEIAQ